MTDPEGNSLYARSETVQPRSVRGRFRSWKFLAMVVLLPWWYLAPFMRWYRGPGAPDQAILIDMGGRRAYFFGLEIWPQEIYYLTGILVVAAIVLFLVSALYGRVWCGFLCWQTVYTDLFVQIERMVIGDRTRRLALDRAPWTLDKLARKGAVHLMWMLIAGSCGIAFTLYFGDAPSLLPAILTGQESVAVYGAIAVVGGFCYLLAGFAREQVCLYMCPYSRFQAAMFDEHSLIVGYETWRGEPRGRWRKGVPFEGRGHCIDCGVCVAVCPTGIDIRKGSQLGCIGCGLCIDGCDAMMDRVGLPRGLITWDSIASQAARAQGETPRHRLVRPRTLVYGLVLAVALGVIGWSLVGRTTTEMTVLHERALLYVRLSDGSIRNGYVVKIQNKIRSERLFNLTIEGLDGVRMSVIGGGPPLKVAPDSVGSFTVFVTAAAGIATGRRVPLTFVLRDVADGSEAWAESLFVGPDR